MRATEQDTLKFHTGELSVTTELRVMTVGMLLFTDVGHKVRSAVGTGVSFKVI